MLILDALCYATYYEAQIKGRVQKLHITHKYVKIEFVWFFYATLTGVPNLQLDVASQNDGKEASGRVSYSPLSVFLLFH